MPKLWERWRARPELGRDADDGSTSTIDADENVWWAAREQLATTYEPPPRVIVDAEPRKSGFEEYFSTESLFSFGPTAAEADVEDDPFVALDPYTVLGVPESSSWEEITAAHRRLAKLHHPDRLLQATGEDRERSERRMRELNIAYSELRRRRDR